MNSRHRQLCYETLESRQLLATVDILGQSAGDPGSRVTVPVRIDGAAQVRAAEIRVAYDAAELSLQPQDVGPGSIWSGGAAVLANVDEAAGEVVVFLFAAQQSGIRSGSLVDIQFTVRSDACPDTMAVDLVQVQLNEGQIEVAAPKEPGAATAARSALTSSGIVDSADRGLGKIGRTAAEHQADSLSRPVRLVGPDGMYDRPAVALGSVQSSLAAAACNVDESTLLHRSVELEDLIAPLAGPDLV